MNAEQLLKALELVLSIVTKLEAMGLQVTGSVSVSDLLALAKV
jgi:hypothetical protein